MLLPTEGEAVTIRGVEMIRRGGILRARRGTDAGEQAQTARAFAYEWGRRETFESEAMLEQRRRWLRERYGDVADASGCRGLDSTLDAGCGAGSSAIGLFGDRLRHIRYLGVDVFDAVDVARARFAEHSLGGAFLQADLTELPLPDESVAVILSEGVLHHTPSTRQSLHRLLSSLLEGDSSWYAPAYAHRQSPDEVRRWCAEAGLEIEREVVEEAGLSVIARRRP